MDRENRRAEDERFKFIQETLQEVKDDLRAVKVTLQGNNGICNRISVVETKTESQQAELSEHKSNHWQYIIVLTGIAGVAVGIIELIKGKL